MMRLLLLFVWLGFAQVQAQHTHHALPPPNLDDPSVAAFVATARAATEPYHDLDVAIAAGYRLMGPDMPNMGEHWIHPGRAVGRTVDPSEPAVLTYLDIEGEPILTGVAYAVPVRPGEAAPPPPVPGTVWHFHSADLNEEAFGAASSSAMHSDAPTEGYRLAMLHAWIWLDNPNGLFAADNWALPYARMGMAVPDAPNPRAARAVFLLTGGVDYYTEAVRHTTVVDAETLEAVRAVLHRYAEQVRALVDAETPKELPGALDTLWAALWETIRSQVPADQHAALTHFAE